jgi:hypothetical protein
MRKSEDEDPGRERPASNPQLNFRIGGNSPTPMGSEKARLPNSLRNSIIQVL